MIVAVLRMLVVLLVIGACGKSSSTEPPVSVPDPKKAAAAHDAKRWKECAELWLAVAATTKGEAMANPLYDAACCQAQGGEIDAAFATLDRAVTAGLTNVDMGIDVDLAPLRADPRWKALLAKIAEQKAKLDAAITEPAVRDELLALEREDQTARANVQNLADPLAVAQTLDDLDAKTTARMKDIVARHGWPGKSLVGRDGAHAAWLLVQHSRDLAFQKVCLEKLELAVTQGEAQAVEHAYLYDRVAVQGGKPQRWGTQYHELTPYPIEDESRVDERRKAIGLPSMAEQLKLMRATHDPE